MLSVKRRSPELHQSDEKGLAGELGYVFKLCRVSDSEFVAACQQVKKGERAKNVLKVFDEETLHVKSSFEAHGDVITDLNGFPEQPSLLASSSFDGKVKVWDLRAVSGSNPEPSLTVKVFPNGPAPLRSFAVGKTMRTLAAGAECEVRMFDLRLCEEIAARNLMDGTHRSAKPFYVYDEIHSGEVNVVKRHPLQDNVFISGGEDGMVCIFNSSGLEERPPVEEDAEPVWSVKLDGDEAVRDLTLLEDGRLLVCSTTELLAWYSTVDPCTPLLSDKSEAVRRHPLLATEEGGFGYVVSSFTPSPSEAFLLAGNNSGKLLMLKSDSEKTAVHQTFSNGGHTGVVRGAILGKNNSIITGGEDGAVCVWSVNSSGLLGSSTERQRVKGGVSPY